MNNPEKILVFKTNLESAEGIERIRPILDDHPEILKWNVDQWDIDNVLRVVVCPPFGPSAVIELVRNGGFDCAELAD